MARGRFWTPEEDDLIRRTVADNRNVKGILRMLALMIGRTPAAVRKRAERLGVTVYAVRRLPGFGRKSA